MNKAKVIGLTVTVLAVIGGVAVYNWVKKPKKNSEGFFGADGKKMLTTSSEDRGTVTESSIGCMRPNGSYYYLPASFGRCNSKSDKRVS